ncbi:putative glutamate carboxypeptidase 2 [Morella rubra]|uniref:Aminopeptidase NAALADL1 n=1 Tax=Morella rubra TaxID=262757 RepID=A0A6A1UJB2_9ROSI|nr:putative glutamate carboxypeptidase 2 [Morella rubra]
MAEAAFSKTSAIFMSKPSPPCTFLFVLILCILGFYTLHYPHPTPSASSSLDSLRFRQIFLSSATNHTLSSYLRALTLHPHLAGTKASNNTAHYVRNNLKDLGLETRTTQYRALLSYPVHSSLSAHFGNGTFVDLPLKDFTQETRDVVPPYHAYSPSGSAQSKAVFVNHGTDQDYRELGVLGVNVSGCVVIARRGDLPRGIVVQKAEAHGAVAVLLYAEGKGFKKGFERGTVMRGVGDPLSPGWAGVDGGESLDLEDDEVLKRFPKIPSMPVSAEAADVILGSLGGMAAPPEWRTGVRLIGPGPTELNFTYQPSLLPLRNIRKRLGSLSSPEGEKRVVTIQNVFAVVRGSEEPDRYVLLGNHRDAWTYGAVDPNSGTAALLDIARRYALLRRFGWQPRRTIILCSWDAEEFGMVGNVPFALVMDLYTRGQVGEGGMKGIHLVVVTCDTTIGSTEWVEQNLMNLGSKAVAYLNVDCAVQGPGFFVGATPQLDNLIIEVTKKVKDPDSERGTVYQGWASTNMGINIQRLGGVDSDFAPFVQHAGVPSVDIYYGRDFPVYHTAFDSYSWMTNYGDPLFQRHVAVSGIWGLLALHLADDSILPFNYTSYADQLQEYEDVLSNLLDGSVYLHPLTASIQELASAAKEAEDEANILRQQEGTGDSVMLKKRALNDRLMLAERGFLDAEGLQGRQWFKHLIYGPPSDYESKLVFFPGVADAISGCAGMSGRERQEAIQHEIWRAVRAIQRATRALRGELT